MKQIYFITATNTDVGKTHACEIFLKRFAANGKKIGYLKPFETGVVDKPHDGDKLLKITKKLNKDFDFTLDEIVPFQFTLPAAPYVAAREDNIEIDPIRIFRTIDKLFKKCDILVVEGAGGLYVPILSNYFIIDLINSIQNLYNCKTILISPSSLGSINDTLLSQNLLKQYKINFQWYINLYKDKDSFEKVTLPFYKKYFDQKYIQYLEDNR